MQNVQTRHAVTALKRERAQHTAMQFMKHLLQVISIVRQSDVSTIIIVNAMLERSAWKVVRQQRAARQNVPHLQNKKHAFYKDTW